MTEDSKPKLEPHPYRDFVVIYRERGYWPRATSPDNGKRGLTGWNRPGADAHARYDNESGHGIALLTGQKLPDGTYFVAIDVDDDRLLRLCRVLAGGTADIPLPGERRGAKGGAIFIRDRCLDAIIRRQKYKVKGFSKSPVEYLCDELCVIPPTVHPDISQPYRWIGQPLHEFSWEELNEINFMLFHGVLTSKHLPDLLDGTGGTHSAALEFVWMIIRRFPDVSDELISQIVVAALPADYAGDTLDELPEMIRSARNKSNDASPHREDSPVLDRLNEKYFAVPDGGKACIHYFNRDGQSVLMSFPDFHHMHSNDYVAVNGKNKPIGKWWTGHPQRRTYEGLTFRPDLNQQEVDGQFNLWRGWGVEPVEGDWSLMQAHLRDVVAGGDDSYYDYIVGWCAWTVQHPADRAEVALVMVGGKGTGKGTLGNAMCRIYGMQHSVHITSAVHLTGKFNEHQRAACLLFADEAYWPGDKASEGRLKGLITEPTLFIEPKGRKAVRVPNMLHVIVASNEDWVVPAGQHERRYQVFRVSEHMRQNPDWFGPLHKQLENGGLAAMLYDLLRMDLGDWHPRNIIETEALREQQQRNLDPFDDVVVGYLETGVLPGYLLGVEEKAKRPDVVLSWSQIDLEGRSLRDGLYDRLKERPALRNINETVFARWLKERYGAVNWRSNRFRGWQFPPLLECRAMFEDRYPGHPWQHPEVIDWADGTADEPNPEY
jgi:hypothetical protein